MDLIEINSITKRFGDNMAAIDNVSLSVKEGEVLTLLGPSGCGKTTTLRAIAGLETISEGEIALNGQVIAAPQKGIFVPPELRDLGMVFQSYALWPHMSISQNIALGLKVKKLDREAIEKRVAESLALVGLSDYADRSPSNLSGGQQQRVALARAVALRPKCVLFDEPLSNLDLLLREQMRVELRRLVKELGITAIYVTHDQPEALVISDTLVVMSRGKVQQVGRPVDVYRNPANLFSAEFLGGVNTLALAGSQAPGSVVVSKNGVAMQRVGANGFDPETHVLAFRPEALIPSGDGTDAVNLIEGRVTEVAFLGTQTEVRFRTGNDDLMARVHGYFSADVGNVVRFAVAPEEVMVLDKTSALA